MRAREAQATLAALDARTTRPAGPALEARRCPHVPSTCIVLGRLPVLRGWDLRRRLRPRRPRVRRGGHDWLLRLWFGLCRLWTPHSQPKASAARPAAACTPAGRAVARKPAGRAVVLARHVPRGAGQVCTAQELCSFLSKSSLETDTALCFYCRAQPWGVGSSLAVTKLQKNKWICLVAC